MKKVSFKERMLSLGLMFLTIALFTTTLCFDSYTTQNITYACLGLSIISGIAFTCIYGKFLYKRLNKKNSYKWGSILIFVHGIFYGLYHSMVNYDGRVNFIAYCAIMVSFYVSFYVLILGSLTIYYYWFKKDLFRKSKYFVIVLVATVLILYGCLKLFSLPSIVFTTLHFIYFMALILLFLYIITLIIKKIIHPIEKKNS